MTLLAIMQPLAAVVIPGASSPGAGLANVLTPNPKEAFVSAAGGAVTIALDLGAAVDVDTFFLGYTNAAPGSEYNFARSNNVVVAAGTVAHSYRRAPLRHAGIVLDAPVNDRFFELVIASPGPLTVGIAAVGRSIRPSSGHDWGAGRPVTDQSQVERLFDGSFGTARGGVAGGWSWSMPALTDDEVARLYALVMDVGIGGDILVLEPDIAAPGGNEAFHWGKLTKLEPAARQAPGETKWDMQVWDWA